MDCKENLGGNTFKPNYLCNDLRVIAPCCKIAKNRLKIRRPLRSWGFDPPSRHHKINNLTRLGRNGKGSN
jgi:hypothetical protein